MRLLLLIALLASACHGQAQECKDWGKRGKLLYSDDFDTGLGRWHAEIEPKGRSTVSVVDRKLRMDVGGGATAWFTRKLEGDVLITFTRKVIVAAGVNDRLSDLNMFWMASDPANAQLFTRQGAFAEYDGLQLYYAGIGGNTNTTSRFRRYSNGERILHADLGDAAHLLEANREYAVKIAVYRGCTRVLLDGREYFQFRDPTPLRAGYFGLRTTQSRQDVDDFRVYRLR